ncbi:MAG: starch-binding protein [Ruminococcus sp.]|nr:starch-binding protein [Ruminococcus sp.]
MKTRLRKSTAVILSVMLLACAVVSSFAANAAATAQITYSFSGTNAQTAGYAEGTITLSAPAGTYWLYWADNTRALEGYSEIAKLTVSSSTVSHKMYAQTAIPADATKLIAISSSSEPTARTVQNASAVYDIPSAKLPVHKSSEKNYSFASYSDIHIDGLYSTYKYADDHWREALQTAADRKVDFIVESGDYTNNNNESAGIQAKEWKIYQKILAESDYCNPIYEAIGNHELWQGVSEGTSSFINATGLEGSNNTASKAYFEKDIMGDHFIFMALEGGFYPDRVEEFSTEQLNWLEGLLKKYSGDGHNIYIVEHSLFYRYGAGDTVTGAPYYDIPLSDNQASTVRFKSLLEKYKDTIFISGHTHIAFSEQYNYSDNNRTSAQMIHNSSVGGTRHIINGKLNYTYYADQTEGYIVDVYDNAIIFNGTNLYYNEYDPNCCYIVRTSQQAYQQMTSTEPSTKPSTEATTVGTTPSSYYLKGTFNSWGTNNPLYYTSDSSVVSTTLQLSAGTYTFKINYGSAWYGNNGTIEDTTTKTSRGGWVMDTSAGDCTLTATGGYYTFNFDTSTKKLILLYSEDDPNATESTETTTSESTENQSSESSSAAPESSESSATTTTDTTSETIEETTEESTSEATEETSSETTEETAFTESSETSSETASSEASSPIEGIDYTLGDVNADGNINIIDATLVQKYAINISDLTETQRLAADVNKDGEVDINDATEIQKYTIKLILSFDSTESKSGVYSAGAGTDTILQEVENNLSLYYRYSSYDCYQALKKEYRADKALGALDSAAADRLTQLQNALLSVVDPNNVDGNSKINVYFENTKSWSSVYAYCWKVSGVKEAVWPGNKMTYIGKNDSGKSIYKYTVDMDAYPNIIFSNGSSEQTVDIALTSDSICYYLTSSSSKYSVASYIFKDKYIVSQ